jgi:photosystem II stability/assembly factor-like uncharacterized protein
VFAAVAIVVGGWAAGSKPVPAGFNPTSFTAVSAGDYWVLGTVPCRAGRCSSILRTTDGGGRFAAIPAPPLAAAETAGMTATLRFADRRNGFAFTSGRGGVGSVLYASHDGGSTWHRLALGNVLAFATGAGNAYLVTARCFADGCRRYRFRRSPVAIDAWTASTPPFALAGSFADLAAHGPNVWLLGTPPSGPNGSGSDKLARSSDGGRTFVTGPGPCVPGRGGELAPSSPDVVWAECPGGNLGAAWRSTDGGVRFTRVPSPPLVNSAALAPASSDTAVVAPNGAGSRLLRTTDAGATWTRPSTPRAGFFWPWIGFTDALHGAALVQTRYDRAAKLEVQQLWRTTDGGATWFNVRFA